MAPLPFVGQSLELPDSEASALNRLTPSLYEQLRRLARRDLVGQQSGRTFSTAELINEAYLKLTHSLTVANLTSEQPGEEVLAIDEALKHLSELDPRKSQIVELRYFGGLGIEEVAQVVSVSTGTVKREWEKARRWLRRELGRGQGE